MGHSHNVSSRADARHGGRRRLAYGTPPPLAKPAPAPLPRQVTHEEFKDRWLALPEVAQLDKVPWSKLDRLLVFYDWLWRGARGRGSSAIDTTLGQAAAGAGGISVDTVSRYVAILGRMGLATMHGVTDASGRTRRSEARLLDPDLNSGAGARSSAG